MDSKAIIIGENFIRKSHVVLGDPGGSHHMNEDGTISENFPHTGGIIIGDNVEIQTMTQVQRGTRDFTIIGHGTKILHQCNIGHNCVIGNHNYIGSMCNFGGSVITGDHVWMGLGCTFKSHLYIVHHTIIGMSAVVIEDILEPYGIWVGNPAKRIKEWDGVSQPF